MFINRCVSGMLFFLFSSFVFAVQSVSTEGLDVYIYDFKYGGTGCKKNTASAVLSSDHKKISFFFDEYFVDTSAEESGRGQKACNLGLRIRVPEGLALTLVGLDYRGFVDMPPRSYASFTANYFFRGREIGKGFSKIWSRNKKAIDEDFHFIDTIESRNRRRSRCGKDTDIRIRTQIRARQNRRGDHSLIQVDTIDSKADIAYKLEWKTCKPGEE